MLVQAWHLAHCPRESISQTGVACFLIGDPRRPVTHMDDAASPKAALCNHILHDMIIFMRIDPQMRYSFLTVRYHFPQQSMHRPISCYPVDRPVYTVRKPFSLLDHAVSLIRPSMTGKSASSACRIISVLLFPYSYPARHCHFQTYTPCAVLYPLCHYKQHGIKTH